MKKAKTKKVLKGKNKFIRLDDDLLRVVERTARDLKRSQNWVINECIRQSTSKSFKRI
jgi:predicted transcriptional regulator